MQMPFFKKYFLLHLPHFTDLLKIEKDNEKDVPTHMCVIIHTVRRRLKFIKISKCKVLRFSPLTRYIFYKKISRIPKTNPLNNIHNNIIYGCDTIYTEADNIKEVQI